MIVKDFVTARERLDFSDFYKSDFYRNCKRGLFDYLMYEMKSMERRARNYQKSIKILLKRGL